MYAIFSANKQETKGEIMLVKVKRFTLLASKDYMKFICHRVGLQQQKTLKMCKHLFLKEI